MVDIIVITRSSPSQATRSSPHNDIVSNIKTFQRFCLVSQLKCPGPHPALDKGHKAWPYALCHARHMWANAGHMTLWPIIVV